MVELPRACKEEHDKYNTKWAGKGLRKEHSFSLSPRTSLRMFGTMFSRKFPPKHRLHSLTCCRPAHSGSTRSRIRSECNVPAVCDTLPGTPLQRKRQEVCLGCYSSLVHNSMHVKYRKYIKTIQPQPRKPLEWICLAVSPCQ